MERRVSVEEYALSRSKRTSFWKRYGAASFFLVPYLFFFLLFTVYPLIYGVVMSLMKFNIADASQNEWRGFQNYYNILFNPNNAYFKGFWWSMRNTALFSLILVPLGIILPLIFAVLINFEPRGYKIFRAIIYLPSILPVTASGVIFSALFSKNFGYINQWTGLEIDWLGTPNTAWFVIVLLCLWGGWGGNFIILSAGLKNVDKSLLEAASVDGCGTFKKILSITLPAIKPQLILCIFTTIIGYFGLYGQIYVLTGGGPSQMINGVNKMTTQTIMVYLQGLITGTNYNVFGMVSAMGLTLGLFIGIVTGIQLAVTKERPSGSKHRFEYQEYINNKKKLEKEGNV